MDYHICVFTEEEIAAGCMLSLVNELLTVINEDNKKAAEYGLDFIKESIVILSTDGSVSPGEDFINKYGRHHVYCFLNDSAYEVAGECDISLKFVGEYKESLPGNVDLVLKTYWKRPV